MYAIRSYYEPYHKQSHYNCVSHAQDYSDYFCYNSQKSFRLDILEELDYYEILEVSRDADKTTIKKAYRKMARITSYNVCYTKLLRDQNGSHTRHRYGQYR